MNTPESLELFLQEASEHLQFLREYSSAIAEPATEPELLERLYFAAHTLTGTSAVATDSANSRTLLRRWRTFFSTRRRPRWPRKRTGR
jgi:chemotaxis protein histidine kinase CheA